MFCVTCPQLFALASSCVESGHNCNVLMRPSADSFTPAANSNDDEPVAKILTGSSSVTLMSTSRLRSIPISGTRCASSITIALPWSRRFRKSSVAGTCNDWTSRALSPVYHVAATELSAWRSSVVLPTRRGPKITSALGGLWPATAGNNKRSMNFMKEFSVIVS